MPVLPFLDTGAGRRNVRSLALDDKASEQQRQRENLRQFIAVRFASTGCVAHVSGFFGSYGHQLAASICLYADARNFVQLHFGNGKPTCRVGMQ